MTGWDAEVVTDATAGPSGAALDVRGGVRAAYQPIVDLTTGEVVGYEALARGQQHLEGLSPAQLFARARAAGCEADLDWECKAAAFSGALTARMPHRLALFVNAEPRWLSSPCPRHLQAVVDRATSRLQVVLEITERALVSDPAGLLAAVRRIRALGWGVALDDVGAARESLALMPFIEPDVIKLDLRLTQRNTDPEIAAIVNAVAAQAERTGATVLAEGIETQEHLHRALALGATLGQGWMLGRPEPLPRKLPPPPTRDFAFTRADPPLLATPFAAVEHGPGLRVAAKDLLLPMSQFLEAHPLSAPEPPIVLAAFEHARYFTPATAARYSGLADHCSFVAALGTGIPCVPAPGVRGADLPADDALRGEWVVSVVGPHFAAALLAKDLHTDRRDGQVPDRSRRFTFTVTHDRATVVHAARSLLARVGPLPEEPAPEGPQGQALSERSNPRPK